MPAGKQAVIWRGGGGELIVTIIASDQAVSQQRKEIAETSGFEFLGVATVLNVDASRARRTGGGHAARANRAPGTVPTGDLL